MSARRWLLLKLGQNRTQGIRLSPNLARGNDFANQFVRKWIGCPGTVQALQSLYPMDLTKSVFVDRG